MNLSQILTKQAKKNPRKTVIIFEKQRINYKKLNLLTNQLAYGLIRLMHSKDCKIAMLLYNCPEFIITYFTALKIGAIIIPINTFLSVEEIKFILNDCQADILVTSTDFQKQINSLEFEKPIIWVDKQEDSLDWNKVLVKESAKDIGEPEIEISPDDVATIIYTSGTTGRPKGVMLSHQNLLANIDSCLKAVNIFPKDKFLLFLPMFHSFTFTASVLLPIKTGASIIVLRSVKPFSKVIKAIMFGRVSIFIGIPHVYNLLANAKIPWWFRYINPIRLCISGAAPLSIEVLKRFEERLRIPLLEGYGMTEASPVISFNPPDGIRKPGSVGLPLPGIEVKIDCQSIHSTDSIPAVKDANIGEIIVRGKNVMLGYYNLPQETNQTIRDGWLFTGDIGRIDEDGYIYIVDRKKDMIINKGMNIYPKEIEDVLYTHPEIEDVAVIGEIDINQEEVPVAIVKCKKDQAITSKDAISAKEIIQFCQQKLAAYKVPKTVEFWDDLPKTGTGKILKREIKQIRAKAKADK